MINFTAKIPASQRTFKGIGGKTITNKYPSRSPVFTQDDDGRWSMTEDGTVEPMTEADVIDVARKATNWQEIRAAHFPMHGFHA